MDISSSSGTDSRSSSEIITNSETMPASTSNGVNMKTEQKEMDESNNPDMQYCQCTMIDGASIGGGGNARFSVNNVDDNHEGEYTILKCLPEARIWCQIHSIIAKV